MKGVAIMRKHLYAAAAATAIVLLIGLPQTAQCG